MARVTIQVIEGLERGQVFTDLETPVSIGREDDNSIRLNDERISRFHAKIQEDGDRFILTDLDSTNGSRVNGHPVQMRILNPGDQLSIGRCLLLFGSDEEIAQRAAAAAADQTGIDSTPGDKTIPASSEDASPKPLPSSVSDDFIADLFPGGPPELPESLRPVQRAQISDTLAYIHEQIRVVLSAGQQELEGDEFHHTSVDWQTWQKLVRLEMYLSKSLREIAEPDDE